MFKRSIALLFLPLLAACSTSVLEEEDKVLPEDTEAYSGQTEFDMSQSYISFVGKSNIIDHEGTFEDYTVILTPDASNPSNVEGATVEVTIQAASVRTDAGVEDHLRREDFFDAEQHPEVTFTSTSIESVDGNQYQITGDLTIKGVTETVTLNAEITDTYVLVNYDLPRRNFSVGNDSYGDKILDPIVPVEAKLVFAE